MSHKFSKGIEEIKKIGLSSVEKSAMLFRIFEKTLPVEADIKPVRSPWLQNIFASHHFRPVLALALVFLLSGGGLIFGSNQALPGDALYGLKVNITEPLFGSLKFSGEAKAAWQTDLAAKRLNEAVTLEKEGRLDKPKQLQIESLLSEHVSALKSDLKIIEAKDSQLESPKQEISNDRIAKQAPESAPTLMMMSAGKIEANPSKKNSKTQDIRLDFESKMNSGANFLESISSEKSGTTSNEALNISKKARESGQNLSESEDDNGKYNEELRILNLKDSSTQDSPKNEVVEESEPSQSLPASVGSVEVKVEINSKNKKGRNIGGED